MYISIQSFFITHVVTKSKPWVRVRSHQMRRVASSLVKSRYFMTYRESPTHFNIAFYGTLKETVHTDCITSRQGLVKIT